MEQIMTLEKYDKLKMAIQKADTIDEVKQYRDVAIAANEYASATKLPMEMQIYCGELRARAERQLGLMLKETQRNKGRIKIGNNPVVDDVDSGETPSKLSELGLTRDDSYNSKKLANVVEEEFENYITNKKQKGEKILITDMRKLKKIPTENKENKNRRTPMEISFDKNCKLIRHFRVKIINKFDVRGIVLIPGEDPIGAVIKEYKLCKEALDTKIESLKQRRKQLIESSTQK